MDRERDLLGNRAGQVGASAAAQVLALAGCEEPVDVAPEVIRDFLERVGNAVRDLGDRLVHVDRARKSLEPDHVVAWPAGLPAVDVLTMHLEPAVGPMLEDVAPVEPPPLHVGLLVGHPLPMGLAEPDDADPVSAPSEGL